MHLIKHLRSNEQNKLIKKAGLIVGFLLLCGITFTQPIYAGPPAYDGKAIMRSTNGGYVTPIDLAVDLTGNSYVCGIYNQPAYFDNTQLLPTADIDSASFFVTKNWPNKTLAWVKSYPAPAGGRLNESRCLNVVIHPYGPIAIFGSFKGNIDLNPGGTGGKFNDNNDSIHYFYLYLDANGNYIQSKLLTELDGIDINEHHRFLIDKTANMANIAILTASYTTQGETEVNTLIHSFYLTDGSTIWSKNYNFMITDFTLEQAGLLIFCGVKNQKLNLTALDTSNGDEIWVKESSGSGSVHPTSISTTNPVITGSYTGTVDFGLGDETVEKTSSGNGTISNIFVLKVDGSGFFQWIYTTAGQTADGYGLSTLTDNYAGLNMWVYGVFQGTAHFDPDNPGVSTNSLSGGDTGFLLQLNQSGEFDWVGTFESTDSGAWAKAQKAFIYDYADKFYMAGSFKGNNLDCDFTDTEDLISASEGDSSGYLITMKMPEYRELTVDVVGNGYVINAPDQTSYSPGQTVELMAFPEEGWRFRGWTEDLTTRRNPVTITLDANKYIIAHFVEIRNPRRPINRHEASHP